MANRTVGIDFGNGIIRAAEVEDPGTSRQQVVRVDAVPISGDAVVSGEVRDAAAVTAALKQLWVKAGFRTKRVVLGMGNSRVLARDLQVPVRPLSQVREGLQFLVADMLPMPVSNAVLDYYPISIVQDDDGNDVYSGMLIAALKDVALTAARAAKAAGLEVNGIDMIPFALIRSLSSSRDAETRAFVDVGATTTIIAVATSGVPEFVRTVPSGGEDVTRSLMDLGQLTREQAEQIKRTVGLSAEGVDARYRPVVELMVTRSGELMTSIRDTLQYFGDTRQRRVSQVLLTGGGARLGGFPQMITAWTRIPAGLVSVADPDFIVATALASGGREKDGGSRKSSSGAPLVGTDAGTKRSGFLSMQIGGKK
ncbi:MAG: pilus assembly protein PilM [Microbacterium sp.]|nr:pilus assembly protein PilM [Microbacterium sp.]